MIRMGLFFSLLLLINGVKSQTIPVPENGFKPSFETARSMAWADSVMKTLTPRERAAQLLVVAAYPNGGAEHWASLEKQVREKTIGGVIWFQGTPQQLRQFHNRLASAAAIPLFTSIDAEWGLAMRIDSVRPLPRNMMLGAGISGESDPDYPIAVRYGEVLAEQCRQFGIGMNMAPVVDVNNNPENPVIGVRSFGQDADQVAALGSAVFQGMNRKGVMACAKHFPGHGDTETDSHTAMPVIWKGREDLEALEWVPFRRLIAEGIPAVMVAHVDMPNITGQEEWPASLSPVIINDILKKEMGFRGLVITDALNMKGVAIAPAGELEVLALNAGNDILLFPQDPALALKHITEAVASGRVSQERIDESCRKVLMARYAMRGISQKNVSAAMVKEAVASPEHVYVHHQVSNAGITLLQNERDFLPLKTLDTLTIGMVTIGGNKDEWFELVERYAPVKVNLQAERRVSEDQIIQIEKSLSSCNVIILNIHGYRFQTDDNFGVPYQTVKLVNLLCSNKKVIVNMMGSPYAVKRIFGIRFATAITNVADDGQIQRDLLVQKLFGATGFSGALPVDASARFAAGISLLTTPIGRMEYTVPEALGIKSSWLAAADAYAIEGITEGAYPGCQVLAAKNGKVFYAKSFGGFTYNGDRPVKNSDLYDLASVTKIAASTAAIMKLVDMGQMSVDSTLGCYLPDVTYGTPFNRVNIRHMMTHQAGLHPWIPFYVKTLKNGYPDPEIYAMVVSDSQRLRVAEKMYIAADYRKVILNTIVNSGLSNYRKYKYSDMGYYLLQEIIERKQKMGLNQFVDRMFYKPMGISTLTYTPLEKFPKDRIAPTENDTIFRKQQLQGDVHDQGAAMLGGVAGHAGLFGNMYHLAGMMQMFCNYGEYGGQRYLEQKTVKEFVSAQFPGNGNRRGIGFDRPVPGRGPGPTCQGATDASFGHTGFTGITAWADPETGIVFIFLSNRVYPIAENNKIISMGTRTRIQQVFYDACAKAKQ
jgi:beta-glucosidase-like glycosyl hydrolase/CubicO group peptidase (beta-lactamase class C family)